uniref:RING-type E3 ubiquitin transferase n=1 Tax=Moniliophthora roreri TaxID=221103 RepID=A0A0W0EYZ4_MONRR
MDASRNGQAGSNDDADQRRSSIPSLLIALVMLFLLTSHNSEEFLARHQYQEALHRLMDQYSNYTAWMNGTSSNFSLTRDITQWPLIHTLLPHNGSYDPLRTSFYSNITGFIHGDAKYYNISPETWNQSSESVSWAPLAQVYMANDTRNMTEVAEKLGTWNWTIPETVAFSIVEKAPVETNTTNQISLVHGRLEFADNTTSEELKFELEGVHFIDNGTIFAFVEPQGVRSIDIRNLPSIVPEHFQNETARLIGPELSARIDKLKYLIDAGIIEQDNTMVDAPRTSCPFQFYAQLDAVHVPRYLLQEYESELQMPTGIRTIKPPKLSMRGVLVSKECGILYEITNVEGIRLKAFFRKITSYAGTATIAYLVIVIYLTRQMARSSTPPGISRVSRWSFLTQATVDAVSFAGHITFAILAEGRPSLSLIAPAFIACITFIYEAQFAMLIHQIQLPEDAVITPPRPPIAAPTATTSNTTPSPTSTPATGQSVAQPDVGRPAAVPAPPAQPNSEPATFGAFMWQQIRSDPQARLWVILFVFLTSIVRIILSPTLTFLFVGVTYSMIWLPQIIRSIRRGRNSGLAKEYILGTTAARLYLLLYFLTCPKNVLEIRPRREYFVCFGQSTLQYLISTAWARPLAAFVCLQAAMLLLQELFGPSFFLPKRFAAVKTYDYHPPMPLPDPEAPEQTLGDCSICMEAIQVDPSSRKRKSGDWDARATGTSVNVMSSGGILDVVQKGVGQAVNRKYYSLAPCHHLFHTECLERWLAIKNICPQCRRPLPPL